MDENQQSRPGQSRRKARIYLDAVLDLREESSFESVSVDFVHDSSLD